MSGAGDEDLSDIKPGPIAWFAAHPVAANLLMIILIMGGILIYSQTTKEVFPEFRLDAINVSVPYPGASPEEVEQGIVLALEDAVNEIDGIDEITSSANEGSGSVSLEVEDGEDVMAILQDVKTAVDRVTTFPDEAEEPSVSVASRRRDVVTLALYGEVEESVLRAAAEQVRDMLEQDKETGPVELVGARDYEIHIEVPQENLRRYDLNLPAIATTIRQTALELGGGRLETDSGEILVRMTERRDTALQFGDIPIITLDDGTTVRLRDIADIREGFEDTNNYASFDGKPAILIDIYRIGEQTPISVSDAVKGGLDLINVSLPDEVRLTMLNDGSDLFRQRAELLIRNGLWGLGLVVVLLAIFLDIRLAFWVSMGIPISFAGAFLLFPLSPDFSINIVSMFAFIISLGIVVDDAIISGENIYTYRQKGYDPVRAAIYGAREIALPITISVITNMVAFLPLFFVPGVMGNVFKVIPVVVMAAFFISLVESLFILPAHLRFKKADKLSRGPLKWIIAGQKGFNTIFEAFIRRGYVPFLSLILKGRYLVTAIFVCILMVMAGYVLSGRMGMTNFPRVESDYAFAEVTLKVGSPDARIAAVQQQLVTAAGRVVDENGGDELAKGIFASVRDNRVQVRIYLTEPDIRPVSTKEVTALWRDETGELVGIESSSFQSNRGGPGSGSELTIELSHRDTEVLDQASRLLAEELAEFPLTEDIDDGSAQGKRQYDLRMKPLGHTLGFTTQDVARQVRAAFFGSEALKQQRGRNEVTVLVRLPEEERRSEYNLMNLVLKAPDGSDVMLRDIVTMTEGRAYTTINRRQGRRVVSVQADVEPPERAVEITTALTKDSLPHLQERFPGLTWSFEGRQAEMRDSIVSLLIGLVAVMFIIYSLLAVLFSSYTQPLMIMVAIPFSAVGAVLGHMLMDYSLSVISLFGMLALAGVVVNDSLILVDFANRYRHAGEKMIASILMAGERRFRPILLTTMTTFVGLSPMILETSRQAKFLIPMAISLGFGILFATLITLVLVPCLYVIIDDIRNLLSFGASEE